ncbi:hypothetical protein D7193_15535 [Micromonospora costi]|uniref:Uncharacterized protein n=2 Tax=Micromonospora costi TaxID=1530042 RepID=A0A3B0A5V6_9ACTN|nr:hypothetical protein D7193_15535 [Micromonospora costi]
MTLPNGISREIRLARGDYRLTNKWQGTINTFENYRNVFLEEDTYYWGCWTVPRESNYGTYLSQCFVNRKTDNSQVWTANILVEPMARDSYNGELGEWFVYWQSRLIRCSESSEC